MSTGSSTEGLAHLAESALADLQGVFRKLAPGTVERLTAEILRARRIACHGVGREGLMMKAFCMRLFHLGLPAHVVGDMTTPPLGPDDLLMVSAGPGAFATVVALLEVARTADARTVVITARPDGRAAALANEVIHLPAQTMADDGNPRPSVLPMGSLYEATQLLFFDLVALALREQTGQNAAQMRARHTNLE